MLLDVNSREEGYRTLSNYLEFDLDPKSFDFNYQINRPRVSNALSGVAINRLSRWSVRSHQTGTLVVTSMESELGPKKYQCRLEVDINTHPETSDLSPRAKLSELLDEMEHWLRRSFVKETSDDERDDAKIA